jgi:hypothetical protein
LCVKGKSKNNKKEKKIDSWCHPGAIVGRTGNLEKVIKNQTNQRKNHIDLILFLGGVNIIRSTITSTCWLFGKPKEIDVKV